MRLILLILLVGMDIGLGIANLTKYHQPPIQYSAVPVNIKQALVSGGLVEDK